MKKVTRKAKSANPLEKLRREFNLSQRQAAIKCGLGAGSWNNWEKMGRRARLSIEQLDTICEVFDVSPNELLR